MRIGVKVYPKAKVNSVEQISPQNFKVRTTTPAESGKANQAVIKLLANFLKIKKNQIFLVSGQTNQEKIFEIS